MHDTIVAIGGTFDNKAAFELRKRIADRPDSGPVILDFTRARDVDDFALAVVAHGLVSDGVPVRFRGLMHHQERMLRYLARERRAAEEPSAFS